MSRIDDLEAALRETLDAIDIAVDPSGDSPMNRLKALLRVAMRARGVLGPRRPSTRIVNCSFEDTGKAMLSSDLCRDCGNMTVPTGSCSTCTVCGSTGGCG